MTGALFSPADHNILAEDKGASVLQAPPPAYALPFYLLAIRELLPPSLWLTQIRLQPGPRAPSASDDLWETSETFQHLHTGGVAIHDDYFRSNVFCFQQGERFLFQCNQGLIYLKNMLSWF